MDILFFFFFMYLLYLFISFIIYSLGCKYAYMAYLQPKATYSLKILPGK